MSISEEEYEQFIPGTQHDEFEAPRQRVSPAGHRIDQEEICCSLGDGSDMRNTEYNLRIGAILALGKNVNNESLEQLQESIQSQELMALLNAQLAYLAFEHNLPIYMDQDGKYTRADEAAPTKGEEGYEAHRETCINNLATTYFVLKEQSTPDNPAYKKAQDKIVNNIECSVAARGKGFAKGFFAMVAIIAITALVIGATHGFGAAAIPALLKGLGLVGKAATFGHVGAVSGAVGVGAVGIGATTLGASAIGSGVVGATLFAKRGARAKLDEIDMNSEPQF